MASITALLQMNAMWEPTIPSVRLASSSRSTSRVQGSSLGVDAEYFQAFLLIGNSEPENEIETAGPHQGRVEQIFPIGGPDDDDLGQIAQSSPAR